VNWNKVTSNLEKLPYYAFNLERHTEKALVKPVPDESLFEFANVPDWKEKLNPETLKKVESIINDYEEALRRVRQARHTSTDMKRKNDIYRILFAGGQETGYSVDVVSDVICFCIASKRDNTDWVHLPVANFDCYYSNTNFSKKWLSKIPDTILEREVASGICRVKLKI